ncbi:hypothetical protein [Chryseobacterium indologenes]|uniref:hypothetical protein n=1 Tax=Chryseobacterium indologenes TaxID=253 RepID=UPI001624971D|nr:hypothetical protein [Chryseobacterium indologenes]
MTNEKIDSLLSEINKIEKSFILKFSHVKAELMAIRDDVAIVPERQPEQNQKANYIEDRKDRIRRSYK